MPRDFWSVLAGIGLGGLIVSVIILGAPCPAPLRVPEPLAAVTVQMQATAYCAHGTTAAGVAAGWGIVAADPKTLPAGSIVRLTFSSGIEIGTGLYIVLDTGSKVRGNMLDLWIDDCQRATAFGRVPVSVRVERYGWRPEFTTQIGAS